VPQLAAATQISDKQEEQMVTTNTMLLELNKHAAEVKKSHQGRVKDVERLKGRAVQRKG